MLVVQVEAPVTEDGCYDDDHFDGDRELELLAKAIVDDVFDEEQDDQCCEPQAKRHHVGFGRLLEDLVSVQEHFEDTRVFHGWLQLQHVLVLEDRDPQNDGGEKSTDEGFRHEGGYKTQLQETQQDQDYAGSAT